MQEKQRAIQAPFQVVSTKFRNSKRETERKLTEILKAIVDLRQAKSCSKEDLANVLASDRQKLNDAKRKLSENSKEQGEIYELCKKRIHRYQAWETCQGNNGQDKDMKLRDTFNQEVINFLNCRGKYQGAQIIQKDLQIEDLTQLQTSLFAHANTIANQILANNLRGVKHWCFENTHMLSKIKSSLQYKLISCQYINILNNAEHSRAINFLRKSLQTLTLSPEEKLDIQKLTILLLTKQNRQINVKPYLEQMRSIFLKSFSKIYHINFQSELQKTLGIGVSSLKTVCCSKEDLINPKICPICEPKINKISLKVPMMTKNQSSIICRLNGSLMTQSNPPTVLPNGQVYSFNGLQTTLKNGKYFCPNTQTFYQKNLCRKVFLA